MGLTKNQIIPLEITGTTAEGSGIGRVEADDDSSGMAVIVPFTAVGDRIRCRILKAEKRLAYGRVEELLTPSGDRLRPGEDCPAFGRCGGCTWRHVTYEAELRYKQQRVTDALTRIGGVDAAVLPIIGSERDSRYRNKAQYPVVAGPYRPLIGFYAPRSHRVVEQHDCLLQPEAFRRIVDIVGKWAKKTGLPIYDEATGKGVLRHLYIREAEATGEIQVCLVCTSGKLPDSHALIDSLRGEIQGLVSVVVNLNREDTNVFCGAGTSLPTSYAACGSVYRRGRFIRSTAGRRKPFTALRLCSLRPILRIRCSTFTVGPGRSAFPWPKRPDR